MLIATVLKDVEFLSIDSENSIPHRTGYSHKSIDIKAAGAVVNSVKRTEF